MTLRAIGLTLFLALANAVPTLGMSAFAPPVVVVYPLTLSGAVNNSEVGSDVAILLASKIGEGGSITVRPYTPGTTRAMYLDAADKQKADYYVTGYLQQIGSDVSMILQVVSTHSGSVVFSSTTTIKTFGDAAAEADPLRAAILRHAGRGLAALDAPPQPSAPTAEPTANQGVNLTRALRHRAKASPSPSPGPSSDAGLVPVSEIQASVASPTAGAKTTVAIVAPVTPAPLPSHIPAATPSPTPTATAVLESRPFNSDVVRPTHRGHANDSAQSTVLVVDTGGTEPALVRTKASASLLAALRRIGVPAAHLPVDASTVNANAASICRANSGTQHFFEPVLTMSRDARGASLAKLSVASVDCTGTTIAQHEVTSIGTAAGGDSSAIDRAALVIAPQL